MDQTSPFMNSRQAAAHLGVSRSTVYRLIRAGRLHALRNAHGHIRISRGAADAHHRRYVLHESLPQVPPAVSAPIEEMVARFISDAGMSPEAWVQAWYQGKVSGADSSLTMRTLSLARDRH